VRSAATNAPFSSTALLTGTTNGLPNRTVGWLAYTNTYTATAADAGKYIGVYFDTMLIGSGNPSYAEFDNFSLTLAVTPAAPAGLTATAGDRQVNLTWLASGALSYNVKRSTDNGSSYVTLTNLSGLLTTNYVDSAVTNGTLYYYVVSAVNGTESTNSAPARARPISGVAVLISHALNANQLQLGWPVDHTGWLLQAQTNLLATGLTTNWLTVSNSDVSNQYSAPINPANGSTFYRLLHP
jgi:hypothetical protein